MSTLDSVSAIVCVVIAAFLLGAFVGVYFSTRPRKIPVVVLPDGRHRPVAGFKYSKRQMDEIALMNVPIIKAEKQRRREAQAVQIQEKAWWMDRPV